MQIELFIDEYAQIINLPIGEIVYRIFFWYFGWLPIAIVFLYGVFQLWLDYIGGKWYMKQKFVFLAIDVPRNNEQSPKAVENLFSYLMGIQKNPNLIEQYWEGQFQLGFSFEIVGIDGYVQFLIRTPSNFKSNIETAVYSQYPDAEITEVTDYTAGTPNVFPDPDFDIWGTEYTLIGPEQLPIKCYREFEHNYGAPETIYKDSMANLMDLLSSLKPGEQCWFQLLINPTDSSWLKKTDEFMAGLMPKAPETLMNMPPHKKEQLEAVAMKKSKICFKVKSRVVYFAKKEVMDKSKVVNGFNGYMRQFSQNNLNGLMPYKRSITKADYFLADYRANIKKNNLISAFKGRSSYRGGPTYLMSVEELATLWHFPIDAVIKAPLLQRAAARKIEAPMTLPAIDSFRNNNQAEPIFDKNYAIEENGIKAKEESPRDFVDFLEEEINRDDKKDKVYGDEPPTNLPFV